MKKHLMLAALAAGMVVAATGCAGLHDVAIGAAKSTSVAVIDNQIEQAVKEEKITESYGETLKTSAHEKVDKLFAEIEVMRQKVAAARSAKNE